MSEHRGRRCYDDEIDPSTQQQLAQDQAGLDRFPETDVIGDKQVDPRQQKRLAQRFQLVGIEADARSEWRLKEARVRRRNTAPAHRPGVGGEELWIIEALFADAAPAGVLDHPRVELVLPEHRHRLALCVVIDTSGMDQGCFACARRLLNALDQPATLPKMNKLTRLGY